MFLMQPRPRHNKPLQRMLESNDMSNGCKKFYFRLVLLCTMESKAYIVYVEYVDVLRRCNIHSPAKRIRSCS